MGRHPDEQKWMILGLVHDRGHVSFAEISQFVDHEGGDQALYYPNYENIVLWAGLSEETAKAIQYLLNGKKIFIHPASELTYLADGRIPSFPTAKSLRQYKEPHWMPTCLHHTELRG